jgi:hypothetical protein
MEGRLGSAAAAVNAGNPARAAREPAAVAPVNARKLRRVGTGDWADFGDCIRSYLLKVPIYVATYLRNVGET